MLDKVNRSSHRGCFSKTAHVPGPSENTHDNETGMCVDDTHQRPYIGDFPPKDTYREGIYD